MVFVEGVAVALSMWRWVSPKFVIEERSFKGLNEYYRRFVEGSTRLVTSLTQLTEKDYSFVWTKRCGKSF